MADSAGNNSNAPDSVANGEIVQRPNNPIPDFRGCEDCEDEIRRRSTLTRSAVELLGKIWKDKFITRRTKVRLMRRLVLPIFLYGIETGSLNEQGLWKIGALKMWRWRWLFNAPWSRTDDSIPGEYDVPDRLSAAVQMRLLKFFRHVSKKESSNKNQIQLNGKRSSARSKTRWTELMKKTAKATMVLSARKATKGRSIKRRGTAPGKDGDGEESPSTSSETTIIVSIVDV